jgi:hypothetical protein
VLVYDTLRKRNNFPAGFHDKPMKKTTLTAAAAALCLLPASTLAQLVYEPFEYTIGINQLSGKSGGTGFSGAWSAPDGGTTSPDIQALGLRYIDSSGKRLEATGSAALVDGPSTVYRNVPFNTIPAETTTMYVSMIGQRVAGNQSRFANLAFFEGSTERFALGHPSNQNNWSATFSGTGSGTAASTVPATEKALLVMKVELNVNGGVNDRISIFVNPTLGSEPATPNATFTSTANIINTFGQLTRIRLAAGGATSTTTLDTHALFDEIRIGVNWAEITPQGVAEPTVSVAAATLNKTGGTFRFFEEDGAEVDPTKPFTVILDNNLETELPLTNVVVTKSGAFTTLTYNATFTPARIYNYYIIVPWKGGNESAHQGTIQANLLPATLPGPAGIVGRWGIREYTISGGSSPNIDRALQATANDALPVTEGSAPVLNHTDPNTNNPNTTGNFNNDFAVLSDAPGDQNWVVVGKTQVSIPAPGNYTFSVHSDDGFAMRVTGAGGGRFVSRYGAGIIDPADDQVIAFDGTTGDSNTRGVYQFDAAGTYDILYLGFDNSGGGYHEVAWAQGTFFEDKDTNTWTLVGNSNDPSIPAYRTRFIQALPGPLSTGSTFGIRTFLNARNGTAAVTSVTQTHEFLTNTLRQPNDADGLTIDSERSVLNAVDPDGVGAGGVITPNEAFPGDRPGVNEDNVVISAKGRINVAEAGFYTFFIHGDDGYLFRLRGVNGTFNPSFKRAVGSGTFQMSNQNEITSGTGNTRAIVFLAVGQYDLDFFLYENTGGFGYELVSAKGEWPIDTPPTGWQLVGFYPPTSSLALPRVISEGGWKLESSRPGIISVNNIASAEQAISQTLALDPVPAEATTFWNRLDFRDLPSSSHGSFTATSQPFPFDNPTAGDTNYANRATGTIEITVPGEYHLGFQGDDGGYMQIDAVTGPPAQWDSIYQSNHLNIARFDDAEGGTRNRMVVETGTGNSRTLGKINLGIGTYQIKTLVYQGSGGSWWEVIGAQANELPNYAYPLIEKDGASSVAIARGLQLVPQIAPVNNAEFKISELRLTGTPASTGATFNFTSSGAGGETVQISTDMVNWSIVPATIVNNGNGTSSATVDFIGKTVNGNQQVVGQPKLFIRVVRN